MRMNGAIQACLTLSLSSGSPLLSLPSHGHRGVGPWREVGEAPGLHSAALWLGFAPGALGAWGWVGPSSCKCKGISSHLSSLPHHSQLVRGLAGHMALLVSKSSGSPAREGQMEKGGRQKSASVAGTVSNAPGLRGSSAGLFQSIQALLPSCLWPGVLMELPGAIAPCSLQDGES